MENAHIMNVIHRTINHYFRAEYMWHNEELDEDTRMRWQGERRALHEVLGDYRELLPGINIHVEKESGSKYTVVYLNGERMENPFPEIYAGRNN